MTTPAIENIISYYGNIELTIIGSNASIEAIMNHPKIQRTIVLDKKFSSIFRISKSLGHFDVFFSFRSSLKAKILRFLINSKNKFQYDKKKYQGSHQVEKYVNFINDCLDWSKPAGDLKINPKISVDKSFSKTVGINPGAAYGSAKRWYPEKFAKVATELSKNYDIIIFGSNNEKEFARKIEILLKQNLVKNYQNLVGKTSVTELIQYISNLDVFITGDSGSMHLASGLKIPTIALFGPTNSIETSQWNNPMSIILKKNLSCQPCMKRICPLKHHNCMKSIKSSEVINSIPLVLMKDEKVIKN